MASNSVKAVFGGAALGGQSFPDEESIEKVYKLLEEGGCDTIDTARLYGDSEESWENQVPGSGSPARRLAASAAWYQHQCDHSAARQGDR
jgi:aryl-alcohol dehydrogenase-like predicted oxidoreductase